MDSGQVRINIALGQAVNQLKQLRGELQAVDRQAADMNKQLAGLQSTANTQTRSLSDIRNAANQLVSAYRAQTTAINQLIQSQKDLNSAQKQTSTSTSNLTATIGKMVVGIFSVQKAWQLFTSTLGRAVEMESLQKTFYAVQGSMTGAATEMQYLRKKSQQLGLDFMALAQSYKGFSAAAKFAHFDLSTTRDMFNAVAESATVLGLSGDKTKLVLMALEQMISKGTVSMEELRRQLGDSLPGAFELGAKAMNMGLAEFNKFVASGKLMSEDFLPKFTKTLRETFGPGLELAMETPRAAINRLMNEIVFAQDYFARVGFLDSVKEGLASLTNTIKEAREDGSIAELGQLFGTIVDLGMRVVEVLIQYGDVIVKVAIALAGLLLAEKAMSVQRALNTTALLKQGIIIPKIITAYDALTLKTWALTSRMFGLEAGFTAARFAAGALFGVVGGIAIYAFSELLQYMSRTSSEMSSSEEFTRKYGMTLKEAEAQLARFQMTVGKPDPLKPFNDSITEATDRLKEMNKEAEKAMEKATKKFNASKTNPLMDVDFENTNWTDQSNVADLFVNLSYKKEMEKAADFIQLKMQNLQKAIKEGLLSDSKDIQSAIKAIQTEMNALPKDRIDALNDSWGALVKGAMAAANQVDTLHKHLLDLEGAKLEKSWISRMGFDDEALSLFENLLGKSSMQGFSDLQKGINGAIAGVQKMAASSKSAKEEQEELLRSQIANYEKLIEAQHDATMQQLENEITLRLIQRTNADGQIKTYEDAITASKKLIPQLKDEALAQEQVKLAIAESNLQLAIGNKLRAGMQLSDLMGQVAAQTAAFKEMMTSSRKTIRQALEGLDQKGGGKGSSNSAQSLFEKIAAATKSAKDQLVSYKHKLEDLRAQLTGDSWNSQKARITRQTEIDLAKIDKDLKDLEKDWQKIAKIGGIQAKNARSEYETGKATLEQIQKRIKEEQKLNIEIAKRAYDIKQAEGREENAANRGDIMGTYAARLDAINLKLEAQKGTEAELTLKYQKRIIEMRQSNNLIGLASDAFGKYVMNMRTEAQDTFSNILPTAINSTTDAFADCFSSIIAGTMSSSEAWNNLGQTMLNIGKQIISMLIKVVIQMLIVKALSAALGMADGGVVDSGGGSATTDGVSMAFGGAWNRGSITAFASGGVLTSPTVFGMAHGGLGVAGEAGPEAFVPLGRTREGKLGIETTGGRGLGGGGAIMIVNVYNNVSDQVATRQEKGTDDQGNPRLDLFIDQIDTMLAGKVASGKSALGKSIDKTRGTSPAKALYV